jgi:2-oxoglutarate ferredoxin oxidoreductase subunit gamma
MKIIIAGSGGQGILFLGKILAFAGMLENKEVTWFPSYGAEMRGGTANCTVIISDSLIGSPVVLNPDLLIIMNKASLDKYQPCLRKKGFLFYDSSFIKGPAIRKDVKPVDVPAIQMAGLLGDTKSANMVMLGAVMAKTGLLDIKCILRVFENPLLTASSRLDINTRSLLEGIHYIENTKG